jgi:predicted  nucleic acid-binding Zn-ribbon protein
MRTVKEEQLQKDVEIWKSRADAHEQNYLQMLKRIDEIIAERDSWKEEAKRWRDMYLEYDEMLEGHINDAAERLDKVWSELEELKRIIKDQIE